jgi:hypothetical protein
LAANVVIAAISFHFFEQPILTLKSRFEYKERPTPADVSRTCQSLIQFSEQVGRG